MKDLYQAVADRRTYYAIQKEAPVSDARIKEVMEHAIRHTPTAFNSQSGRVVLLLGKKHDRLWEIAKEALQKVVPAEQFEATAGKINSFQNGYGTVLYFEDQTVVEGLQQQFPLYKDNFPIWSQQASGMLQYVVWTSLEAEGFGASLQHYGELIEPLVKQEWGLPAHWKLIAQMPFGAPAANPDEKQYQPLEERFVIKE
ncbi:MAG: uncharacterized protein PWP24_282 [Clostridiales bacterium]|nr:uncharacterized protein [Clostridiales bacterium]